MRSTVLALLLVTAGLSAANCSKTPKFVNDLTGGAGGKGTTTSTTTPACPAACDTCTTCATTGSCAAELAACEALAECQSMWQCVSATPDQIVACTAAHPSGRAELLALASCVCAACPGCGECGTLGCVDGKKNGDETSVDCGGAVCPACAGTCSDLQKNNGEVGVDCGGPCPTRCPAGTLCSAPADCSSNACADSVCCDMACEKPCYGCAQAKTGAPDGACAPVPAGKDPASECNSPAGDVCNGAGQCRCHDGIQDGDETGVDCGGSCAACGGTCTDGILDNKETDVDCGGSCPQCAVGKGCLVNADCKSGSCKHGLCACTDPMACTGRCGTIMDACGNPATCPATCPPNFTCGAGGNCICTAPSPCTANHCGMIVDGCGKTVDCGTTACTGNTHCNTSTHTCVCDPNPNACAGIVCGYAPDGCGGQVACDSCAAQNPCGDCMGLTCACNLGAAQCMCL